MASLARAGIGSGINLQERNQRIEFIHTWIMIVARI